MPKSSAIKGESESEEHPSPPTSSPMWPRQGRMVSRESLGARGLCSQRCEQLHGLQGGKAAEAPSHTWAPAKAHGEFSLPQTKADEEKLWIVTRSPSRAGWRLIIVSVLGGDKWSAAQYPQPASGNWTAGGKASSPPAPRTTEQVEVLWQEAGAHARPCGGFLLDSSPALQICTSPALKDMSPKSIPQRSPWARMAGPPCTSAVQSPPALGGPPMT